MQVVIYYFTNILKYFYPPHFIKINILISFGKIIKVYSGVLWKDFLCFDFLTEVQKDKSL